jgi:parvulin-like peptidyl-prolyl isomerase
MKSILSILFLFWGTCAAQNVREQLKAVNTALQAREFVSSHPDSELIAFNSGKDSSELFNKLNSSSGIIEQEGFCYKVVETTSEISFRASYVFLDGKKLSVKQIDSLRKIIVAKYKTGVSFSTLADEYNMDGNRNHGDLGWFTEGVMEEKFESAVRSHKKGELFTLDIKYNKWYYVILKTFDNTQIKTLTVLKTQI